MGIWGLPAGQVPAEHARPQARRGTYRDAGADQVALRVLLGAATTFSARNGTNSPT